ncbi:hypothetical protein PIIN_03323 [Serendipita indica DSM 11827]|uniref:Uncharacterized protein n=1 Tax=Serendipita indica (strain DSM 11827) TaxID=1109443 RepID=G4TDL9_SERID|nr:hypothetical protein PIIN_03323 [Serendipita indica DSM 11827]
MKLWLSFVSLLSLVVGSMAKGRGGRGGGGSIDDNWDVPGAVKATMAFQIIFFIFILSEFITIIRRMRFVPPGRYTRAPYILLAVVAGPLAFAYLLWAIYTRISTGGSSVPYTALHGLSSFTSFLLTIDIAFRPAVCLWLVHLRSNLARTTQGKATKPWISQFWKRIVDWSLVTILFLIGISLIAVTANGWALSDAGQLSTAGMRAYLSVRRGLGFTIVAFSLLLSIDITISFITLKVSQKGMNFIDPVSTRLLVAVLPFVLIDLLETLVVTIYPETHMPYEYNVLALNLADVIINGVCRVGIIWGLLSTMTIPNVLWTPGVLPGKVGEYIPQQPQQPQQSFYQPPWQNSPSMPAPGQYPHPGQYSPPQNSPPGHQPYTIPNNP